MKKTLLFLVILASTISLLLLNAFETFGQNYTSINDGDWSVATNWNNTSGWGDNTPKTNGSSGTRNLNHNQTVNGDYSTGSSTLNIANNRTMIVQGDFNTGGGSTTNISGTLIVQGNMDLSSVVNILPGGRLLVRNDVALRSSQNLIVGNGNAPPPYADLTVEGDLNSYTSGDITINRNGRVAVFGSVNDNGGGGTILKVNDGGQIYVHEDINYSGGGSNIQNNNSSAPYGLYVNGDINNTGGGAGTTTNVGDQQTLLDTNEDFFNWVSTQDNSPLPIELKSFTATVSGDLINLDWTTAKEINFSHFEIERSVDQNNWKQLGIVQGLGESNSDVNYSFTDRSIPFGVIYYRLKSVDIDGSFEYSPTVKAEHRFKGALSIYPNPANGSGKIKIRVPSSFTDTINYIAFYNLQGAKVQEIYNYNPEEELALSTSIKKGLYLLRIQHNGLEENLKILINP